MPRFVVVAALALIASAIFAAPAFAHAHLVAAAPAADASIAAPPADLTLHFSEQVEPGFTGLTLKDPGGETIATGATAPDPADPKTITVPIQVPLPSGRYVVAWHALAVDGHKTSGTYAFIVVAKPASP
jgi:hypothetical protein